MHRVYRSADCHHLRHRLPTGTRAFDVHDERHVGRVRAVMWNGDHRVEFDNGTVTDIPERRVRRATEGK